MPKIKTLIIIAVIMWSAIVGMELGHLLFRFFFGIGYQWQQAHTFYVDPAQLREICNKTPKEITQCALTQTLIQIQN